LEYSGAGKLAPAPVISCASAAPANKEAEATASGRSVLENEIFMVNPQVVEKTTCAM
jgi:hypothetical protein